ncbi:MAG TPA: hypothetical protein VFU06_02450 [Longimicrobiales bacterium]|nr:hypothetical protein [Longimicrobiales bacterium]
MKAVKVIALAAAGVLVSAGSASAQAYFGAPIGDAGFAVRAEVGLPDGSKTYDLVLDANLMGPISFQLFGGLWDIDDVEDNGGRFGGKLGYELPVTGFSVGPFVGAEYTTFSAGEGDEEVSTSLLTIPVGIGIGTTLAVGPTADVALFAQPAYYYMKADVEMLGAEFDESTNEFGAEAGARLGFGRFLVGGSVEFTTVEDSDAVFSLTAGVRF